MNEVIVVLAKNQAELSIITRALSSAGYRVEQAKEFREAYRKARDLSPDMFLVDIDVASEIDPEYLRGGGSSERIRAPVVAMAEPSKEQVILKFLKGGGTSYFIKPHSEIELLVFSVKEFLEKKELSKKSRFLASQLKQAAIRDPLTNTYNYKHLHTELSEEIVRSRRYGHVFCIFIIDIDEFKRINQEFGHLAGDQTLKRLGELLCANVRRVDSVFRYGGDEFVILLPETHKDDALGVAIRLLMKIRNTEFRYDGCSHFIRVSIGASMFPGRSEDKHNLLMMAEKALARARSVGGDTIFFE